MPLFKPQRLYILLAATTLIDLQKSWTGAGAFELRNILRSQLQQLLPSLRVAFILRDIEGLSSEETAEVLDTTVDAVKTRLWRARLKLRQLVTRYFRVGMTRTEMSSAERGQTGTTDNSTF